MDETAWWKNLESLMGKFNPEEQIAVYWCKLYPDDNKLFCPHIKCISTTHRLRKHNPMHKYGTKCPSQLPSLSLCMSLMYHTRQKLLCSNSKHLHHNFAPHLHPELWNDDACCKCLLKCLLFPDSQEIRYKSTGSTHLGKNSKFIVNLEVCLHWCCI